MPEGTDSPHTVLKPAASYSLILRVKLNKAGGTLARVLRAIAETEGTDTGAIDMVKVEDSYVIRDITVDAASPEVGDQLVAKLKTLKDVEVVHVSDRTFLMHLAGKITVVPRHRINNRDDLSMVYTPGVARVCKAIQADPSKALTLTTKGNMVAVISDGSRVLALGNIGAKAAIPVMEGKAVLFKQFGEVDAFPLTLDTQNTEEIIRTIKIISPGFGAINLEDIESPRCYEIEDRLRNELDIPVFHDDQHGTAIVVAAATINAARLTKRKLADMKVVAVGVGAAGMACCKMLLQAGVKKLIGFNIGGAVHRGRTDLTAHERWLAENSNPGNFTGTMAEAMVGADMFLGLAAPGIIGPAELKTMNKDAIVFALANPVPEVQPEVAQEFVRVIATGGSNYPNQINNALAFPGFFRGLLDAHTNKITDEMKMEAARALAAVIAPEDLHDDYIIPSVFDENVAKAVAGAVVRVAEGRTDVKPQDKRKKAKSKSKDAAKKKTRR